ncbi:MAG: beta-propeller fold lactonase family protein [Pirellulaceae bacterium]|nr:beta-propeller fold lactonase family protein [Pirellulaceae bacterium]
MSEVSGFVCCGARWRMWCLLIVMFLVQRGWCQVPTAIEAQHVVVYHEPGRFGGWPANHGIWSWGNEILVGYARGYHKDLGQERHNIDRDRPEQHWLARSLDGGATWTLEHPMDKGQLIPCGEALHGTETPGVPIPELMQCPGGIDFKHPDFALVAKMESSNAGRSRFFYSYNRGHDWTGPFALPNFGTAGTAARTDYIVDGQHTLTMFLTAAKPDNREGRPLAVRTTDGGKSWEMLSWIDPLPEGFAIMPATVRLSDRELLTAVRRRTGSRRWITTYRSLDDGHSWQNAGDPVSDLGEGNPPAMIRLRDGRLCLTYGYRAAPYYIAARLSADQGRSWSDEIVLRTGGANRDIGYPRIVQRPDGKIVVVYYFNDLQTGPERYIAATVWNPDNVGPAPAQESPLQLQNSVTTQPSVTKAFGPQPDADSLSPLMAYVGTFSSPLKDTLPTQVDLPPGNGRGIHIFQVDRQTGALTERGVFPLGTSPSCLAASADGTRLYSANETDRLGPDKHGSISSFAVDRSTGQLTLLNTMDAGGAGPTYVSLHPTGQHLLVANYFGGSVAVLPIQADGTLSPPSHVVQDQGTIGPSVAQHAPPGSFAFSGHDRTHAHMIQADPSGKFALHVDLGLDKIFVSRFDAGTGRLHPNDPPFFNLPPGDGPRHFHFHPNGRWLYCIQEEGSTVVLFDFDQASGRLSERQTISTLPQQFAGSNFCSEILVSHDGRFVYAGNRLYDTIAIFEVGADGRLSYRGEQWTRGNYPRSFTFDPSGSFLYCCNQRADNVAVFRVNRGDGQLEFTGQFVPVGNPSHVLMLELK